MHGSMNIKSIKYSKMKLTSLSC